MNDDVTPKNIWDQNENYTKKLKRIFHLFLGLGLKILALPALLICWGIILWGTFLQLS